VDHFEKPYDVDFRSLYAKIRDRIYNEARKIMTIKNNIKLAMGVSSTWTHKDLGDVKQPVQTQIRTVYSKDELKQALNKLSNTLIELFLNMKLKDSFWSLKKIHYFFLESYDIKPVRGSSYIPTPEK
jgi:hypothetical protein